MNLFRVWCRFEPEFFNEMTGRSGQWRVLQCYQPSYSCKDVSHPMAGKAHIAINSTKPYRRGSIIRPHKELNRVLNARKTGVTSEHNGAKTNGQAKERLCVGRDRGGVGCSVCLLSGNHGDSGVGV